MILRLKSLDVLGGAPETLGVSPSFILKNSVRTHYEIVISEFFNEIKYLLVCTARYDILRKSKFSVFLSNIIDL